MTAPVRAPFPFQGPAPGHDDRGGCLSLVTLRTFRDAIDAELAKERLEHAGIPAFIFDENLVAIQWLYSGAVGGVKLEVDESDLERAAGVLREDHSAEVSEEQGAPPERETCPACGSPRVGSSRAQRNAAALSLLTSLPLVVWRQRRICGDCGHSWKQPASPRVEPTAETLAAEDRVREIRHYPILRAVFAGLLGLLVLYYIQTQIRPH